MIIISVTETLNILGDNELSLHLVVGVIFHTTLIKRQPSSRQRFTCKYVLHLYAAEDSQVGDMISQVSLYSNVFYLLTSCLCHTTELIFALNTTESATAQVGGYASCSATAEWIEHPVALVRACQYDTRQQRERFLRWVLAARLLPSANGRQSPHVGHLLPIVQPFHHVVVKLMRHLLRFPCPYHKLSGIGEEPARDIHWRIGLLPSDDVENSVAELRQAASCQQVTSKLNLCQTRQMLRISPFHFILLISIPSQTDSIAG